MAEVVGGVVMEAARSRVYCCDCWTCFFLERMIVDHFVLSLHVRSGFDRMHVRYRSGPAVPVSVHNGRAGEKVYSRCPSCPRDLLWNDMFVRRAGRREGAARRYCTSSLSLSLTSRTYVAALLGSISGEENRSQYRLSAARPSS